MDRVTAATEEMESIRERLEAIQWDIGMLRVQEKQLEERLEVLDDLFYEELTQQLKAEGVDIKDTPFYREDEDERSHG